MVSTKSIDYLFIEPQDKVESEEKLPEAGHYDLLIDPDEDPEVAAQIDAQLEEPARIPETEKPKPPFLPQLTGDITYTLVLDLDETLIHYREDDDYYLVRPGVNKFLQELAQLYDIVLFTASVK